MATNQTTRTNSGTAKYSGSWGKAEVLHLLRRVQCGVKYEDISYFQTKTMDQAIDEILNVSYTPPSPPINDYNARSLDPIIAAGATWVNDYNGQLNNYRRSSLKKWWMGQIINHDRTIREKMVLFWHNHFATEMRVIGWANFAYTNNALLRLNCLKNFKSLVKDITLDPAMLVYLNGERNTKSAPDENYSRELQELFTLGKGPESKYTENDVQTGAKVLTGWRINKTTGAVYFDDTRHDSTDKTFSSFYNNTTITGQSGANGVNELDDLLNMIFAQTEVSKHIVRKLYRWFVYYEIDNITEINVIAPLATLFRTSNFEIKPVLSALLKSEHFFDVANRGALIKSPIDFTAGLVRQYDIGFQPTTNFVDLYNSWNIFYNSATLQQQSIGDPPSVAGWSAYYQIPQFHELWINSDTLPNRNKITDGLVSYGYNINGFRVKINSLQFAEKFTNVRDPELLIDDLLEYLHTIPVSQDQQDYMRSILLSGQVQNHYWTDAWDDYANDKNNTTKQNIVSVRLIALLKYLMNLSEFQLS